MDFIVITLISSSYSYLKRFKALVLKFAYYKRTYLESLVKIKVRKFTTKSQVYRFINAHLGN